MRVQVDVKCVIHVELNMLSMWMLSVVSMCTCMLNVLSMWMFNEVSMCMLNVLSI